MARATKAKAKSKSKRTTTAKSGGARRASRSGKAASSSRSAKKSGAKSRSKAGARSQTRTAPRAKTARGSQVTTDHDEIRRWAEQRDGHPTSVKGTGKRGEAGLLRIDFDPRNEELEPVNWRRFFEKFEKENLAFLYQDRTKRGVSRFHKFIQRR